MSGAIQICWGLLLIFSSFARADGLEPLSPDGQASYAMVGQLGVRDSRAMVSWIEIEGVTQNKAWFIGAGHSTIGAKVSTRKDLQAGDNLCDEALPVETIDRDGVQVPVPFGAFIRLYVTDPQKPRAGSSLFVPSRLVLASIYPFDVAVWEAEVTPQELRDRGLKPLRLSAQVPVVGEAWTAVGTGNPEDERSVLSGTPSTLLSGHYEHKVRYQSERAAEAGIPALRYRASFPSWAGTSGGPVLNRAGEVVGVISGAAPIRGPIDPDRPPTHSDYTHVSPAQWIRGVLDRAGNVDCPRYRGALRRASAAPQ